jgi:3-oxoacyl-[acyl-carrier-protein] synthase-3
VSVVEINLDEKALAELVRRAVERELQPGSSLPENDEDLVKSGAVDSMGWVGILTGLEEATGIRNLGSPWPEGRPQTVTALAETLRAALAKETPEAKAAVIARGESTSTGPISITGWAFALGTKRLDASQIEAECGVAAGTIRERAGIHSVCRAADTEDEVALGKRAAGLALRVAGLGADELDLLVCTSTTFLELPSLAASLHSRLLLNETCAVLDVGGACVGLLNALAAARAFLAGGDCKAALVVASEVHSRRFAFSKVRGEFRGLFGDGACAFVLQASGEAEGRGAGFRLGEFASGCFGSMSSALRVAVRPVGELEVAFDGEALGKGAVVTLNEVVTKLEGLSGVARAEVSAFAFHEPNPRLAAILARTTNVPPAKFTQTAETTGNLGSVTCGVNLCTALTRLQSGRAGGRGVVFVAAVGPGVLWGGTYVLSGATF